MNRSRSILQGLGFRAAGLLTRRELLQGMMLLASHQRRKTLMNFLKADGIPLSDSHDGLYIWVPLLRESTPVVMALAKYG